MFEQKVDVNPYSVLPVNKNNLNNLNNKNNENNLNNIKETPSNIVVYNQLQPSSNINNLFYELLQLINNGVKNKRELPKICSIIKKIHSLSQNIKTFSTDKTNILNSASMVFKNFGYNNEVYCRPISPPDFKKNIK